MTDANDDLDVPIPSDKPDDVTVVSEWYDDLFVRANGTIQVREAIVGRCLRDPDGEPRIVLNLGWLKAVGVGVSLQNDPDVDSARSGFVIQRPAPGAAPEPF